MANAIFESVQRLFTRRIPGFENFSYNDRLQKLHLPSLELRRLRSDLLLCYKLLHGKVAGSPETYGLQYAINTTVTRGAQPKAYQIALQNRRKETLLGFQDCYTLEF